MAELEKQSARADFWSDSTNAQRDMKALSRLREQATSWSVFSKHLDDLSELAGMGDETLRTELEGEVRRLEEDLRKRTFPAMLSGPYDRDGAILAVHAGAGGTDSQDWAAMLQRMYLRWAERRSFATEILDLAAGEEAGTKSVTIAIDGAYAFGYLRSE